MSPWHGLSLVCPIDGQPLGVTSFGLACASGHAFDRARDGHVNLLPVQHKASRDPGDSKEMVAARRAVLDAGCYAPLAARLSARVLQMARDANPATLGGRPFAVLDAGCGEGYYLAELARHAAREPAPVALALAGIDISKWAVRAAAKRHPGILWLVASNRRPPFARGSIDLIICAFGFPVWEGFRTVVRDGGHVLLVDPGPDHLIELRRIIYSDVEQSGPPSLATGSGVTLVREEVLRFTFDLPDPAAIAALVAMTPHAHRIGAAGRAALADQTRLTLTADVHLRLVTVKP